MSESCSPSGVKQILAPSLLSLTKGLLEKMLVYYVAKEDYDNTHAILALSNLELDPGVNVIKLFTVVI